MMHHCVFALNDLFAGEVLDTVLRYGFIYLLVFIRFVAVYALCHIFKAIGLYWIAKRRNLRHPWLAWLPLLNLWTLGSISDQYRYVTEGKVKNKRKWLMRLNTVWLIPDIILFYLSFLCFFATVFDRTFTGSDIVSEGWLIWLTLASLISLGLSVASAIIRLTALYDLFKSCAPRRAPLLLALNILAVPLEPFLIFLNRKKDAGMRPPAETQHATI